MRVALLLALGACGGAAPSTSSPPAPTETGSPASTGPTGTSPTGRSPTGDTSTGDTHDATNDSGPTGAGPTGTPTTTASPTSSTGGSAPTANTWATAETPTGDSTPPTTGDTFDTLDTGPTATTALTGLTTPTAPTGVLTADTGPTTVLDTVCEADRQTADDTWRPTGDTATSPTDTDDTGACGVLPDPPVDTGTLVADTAAPDCDPGCAQTCPQVAWVLHLAGDTDIDVYDMDAHASGDALVALNHERGVTFNEGLPDEIVIDEDCPGPSDSGALARIDDDGHTTWAVRAIDGCYTSRVLAIDASAAGLIAAWGEYRTGPANVGPDSAQPVLLPTPQGVEDEWFAVFDGDGQLVQAHAFTTDTTFPQIDAVTLDDVGNLYVVGTFEDQATFDRGSPAEVALTHTGKAFFVVSFAADGTHRWTRLDALGEGAEAVDAAVVGDELVVHAYAGDVLWDACGPHETPTFDTGAGTRTYFRVTYRVHDGHTTSVSSFGDMLSARSVTSPTGEFFGVGYSFGESIRVGSGIVGPHQPFVAFPRRHRTRTNTVAGQGISAMDADADAGIFVMAGPSIAAASIPILFGCGQEVPTSNEDDPAAWYAFRTDGTAICGDAFGSRANTGLYGEGVAVDTDGSFVVGMTWNGRGIVADGTPHELRLDTIDVDVVLVRYEW